MIKLIGIGRDNPSIKSIKKKDENENNEKII